jgi:hypothetical protein
MVASSIFGVGGSVKLQGSLDGVNWNDVSASPLTAGGFFAALSAAPLYLRPSVTAGDGTTAINIKTWLT